MNKLHYLWTIAFYTFIHKFFYCYLYLRIVVNLYTFIYIYLMCGLKENKNEQETKKKKLKIINKASTIMLLLLHTVYTYASTSITPFNTGASFIYNQCHLLCLQSTFILKKRKKERRVLYTFAKVRKKKTKKILNIKTLPSTRQF